MLSVAAKLRLKAPGIIHWRRQLPAYRLGLLSDAIDARATDSSNFESKSIRMGDWFDILYPRRPIRGEVVPRNCGSQLADGLHEVLHFSVHGRLADSQVLLHADAGKEGQDHLC